MIVDPTVGSPDNPTLPKSALAVVIPKEWNDEGKHEFTVPQEGTDQANFDIVTAKKK
jgi:hypothetical protein